MVNNYLTKVLILLDEMTISSNFDMTWIFEWNMFAQGGDGKLNGKKLYTYILD